MSNPVLITTKRDGIVENLHRGSFVLLVDGAVAMAAGDTERAIYPRSSLKSIQAIAAVRSGAVEQFGLTLPELAIICGSHWAEPRHLATTRSILSKAGVPESALQCGHHPLEDRERDLDRAVRGEPMTAVHHNCSGKHAGMLAAAKALGAPLESYLDPAHPVQQMIREALVTLSGCADEAIGVGSDGCAAPAFRLPLTGMAQAMARVSTPDRVEPKELRETVRLIAAACLAHPEMVAGEKAFCTALMRAGEGKIFSKGGAEAYYAFGLVGRNTGFALKLDDGNPNYIYAPLVVDLARRLGAIDDGAMKHLDFHNKRELRNWRGDVVGAIEVTSLEEF